MNQSETTSATLPATMSLVTPACRMVAIDVWASERFETTVGPDRLGDWDDEKTDHCFHEVLALVAKQEHEYIRPAGQGKRFKVAPTHPGMEALGWRYDSTALANIDALICTADYGVWLASQSLDGVNEAYRLVVAPWHPSEDEVRLADVVTELRAEARDKVAREKQSPRPSLAGLATPLLERN